MIGRVLFLVVLLYTLGIVGRAHQPRRKGGSSRRTEPLTAQIISPTGSNHGEKEEELMAISLKKYRNKVDGTVVRALRITEKNLDGLVEFINKRGGAATGHNGDTRSKRPARIRIKQLNYGETWGKLDWRVAKVGDFIVRDRLADYPDYTLGEFFRVKDDVFEDTFELVK